MKKLILLFIISMCISCTTTKYIDREVPVIVNKTSTEYKTLHDSVYIHDSIDRYINGDSVFMWKYRTVYKTKIDTIVKRDSIPVPTPYQVVKEVNKLTSLQSIMIKLGYLGILFILFILFRIYKYIKL